MNPRSISALGLVWVFGCAASVQREMSNPREPSEAPQSESTQEEKPPEARSDVAAFVERSDDEKKERADNLDLELADIAVVREDERGLVVQVAASLLFDSTNAALSNNASLTLDRVAEALARQVIDKIIIEAHNDYLGRGSFNDSLSNRRADAVCEYLVSRGVSRARISAAWKESDHASDDDAGEDRRGDRVEIVLVSALDRF